MFGESCGILTCASGAPSATRFCRSVWYVPGATRLSTGGPSRCDSRFASYSMLRVEIARSIAATNARSRSVVIASPSSA